MEAIYLYLIKCSGLIVMFFLAYYFLLRKETFFNSNRWFLLAGLFTSVLLPLFFFTKIIWVVPAADQANWSRVPVSAAIAEEETFQINWFLVIGAAYIIGLVLFLIQFGVDFFSLTKVLKGNKVQQQADYKFIDVKQNVAPFSYFNYIVYNSDLYSAGELENILEHEKIHSAQNHTIDVLIARLFCIAFWYNPFIWLYKKAILQNLEFIADSEATKNIADKKAYQITLLKITTHENCVEITNHFYQSLIKKRIVMLNKNQSKKWNSWKYALVIPALAAFVFLFQIKVIAQEKAAVNQEKTVSDEQVIVVIDKNSTDASLKQDAADLKANHGITLTVSKVKRNANSEITGIKVAFKDQQGHNGVNQVNGDKPINPITFVKSTDENGNVQIGFYTNNNQRNSVVNISEDLIDPITIELPEPPEAPEAPESPEAPEAPEAPKAPKVITTISKTVNGVNTQSVYVNGVKTDLNINDIDPETIASVNVDVIKNSNDFVVVNDKAGTNRVITITTKNGVTIKKDVSVDIDMDQIKRDVEQSKRDVEQSKRDVELSKIQVEISKKAVEESKRAVEQSKKAVQQSKMDVEQAKINAQKAKLEADKAKQDAEQAKKNNTN